MINKGVEPITVLMEEKHTSLVTSPSQGSFTCMSLNDKNACFIRYCFAHFKG